MDRPVQTQPTLVERLFAAIQRGDTEQVLTLLHPQAEWTPTAWSGESMYRGQEGVHLWLSQFGEDLSRLDIRILKSAAGEDTAAAHGIVFDSRGSRTFAVQVSWSFELDDGLIRRGRAHDSWEEALQAAGLGSPPLRSAERPHRQHRRDDEPGRSD